MIAIGRRQGNLDPASKENVCRAYASRAVSGLSGSPYRVERMMDTKITCRCGQMIPVAEGQAGSTLVCECGTSVFVPSLSILRAMELDEPSPLPVSYVPRFETIVPVSNTDREIMAPTHVCLRSGHGPASGRPTLVMVGLTADALWLQDTWRLRSIKLRDLAVEHTGHGHQLALAVGPEGDGEKLTLTFDTAAEVERWFEKIQACQSKLTAGVPADDWAVPEGVALVRRAPEVPHVALGPVAFMHRSPATADRGIQLRAGLMGADAIINYERAKCPEMGWRARQVSGLAVRVDDADSRKRLRWKWYAEEVSALTRGMLVLLALEVFLGFVAVAYLPGKTRLIAATGETFAASMESAAWSLALFYGWPLVVVVLLRVLRWRELLRPAGLAVLAVTTVRGLVLILVHLLVLLNSLTTARPPMLLMAVDPVEWAFIIAGARMSARAWQLARRATQMLPDEAQAVSMPRRLFLRGLLVTTGVFALAVIGWAGTARYSQSVYLLHEGVDPRREHQALLVLNQGAAEANKGDFAAADRSLQRALELWEALAARRSAPSLYRANLAMTLNNLGWIRLRQDRNDEAETYYSRAVVLADELKNDPVLDGATRETLAGAHSALAALRGEKSAAVADEKDKAAVRKYEEAEVSDVKDGSRAEGLYREAIAAWEEILPQATSSEYTTFAVARLTRAYIRLGDLQERLGKRLEAEASLKKAIDHGQRSVDLEPARPLAKHNLDVARRTLEGLQEQAFEEEINRLTRAQRFSDAIAVYARNQGAGRAGSCRQGP